MKHLYIRFEKSSGDTPDEEVNKWHLDLVELTASKRLALAMTIMVQAQKERISKKAIEKRIIEAVKAKQLSLDKMHKNLQTKIRSQI